MKLIKQSFEILDPTGYTIDDIYKSIELAGRACYKSSPKYRWYTKDKKLWINEDSEEWKSIENPKSEYPIKGENISAKEFVNRMIKSGHGAMLEHGTVYLKSSHYAGGIGTGPVGCINYIDDPYSICNIIDDIMYVTTNYRVLVENDWLNDLQYLCEPTEFHERRTSVRFICDRGVSHEFIRHRTFSFAQESTRYCNYSKDKFGNEVTFIEPCWNYIRTANYNGVNKFDGDYFIHSLEEAERYYFKLLELGWKPQQARAVLPNALKTELIMTGFVSDWKHFFELRDATSAHPQAQELAHPLHEEFIKRELIEQ